MAFGSLYANWLTLIHAEFTHPWDRYFRYIGFGTAGDQYASPAQCIFYIKR